MYHCKLYKLRTSDSYTWNTQIYDGKVFALVSFGYVESLGITPAETLYDCCRTIYGDNFHSSVPLAEYLFDRETYNCGILRRKRRICPKNVTQGLVAKGKIVSKLNAN